MVAMLHLNFSEGVCVEVSDEHSWSLGTAANSRDEVPSPVMHGSALLFVTKTIIFFSLPTEAEYGLKIQNDFARLVKTHLRAHIKRLLISRCHGIETGDP